MRRSLVLALLFTVLLSTVALWTEGPSTPLALVAPRASVGSARVDAVHQRRASPSVAPKLPLPATWSPRLLEPAERDIFAVVLAPVSEATVAPPPPTAIQMVVPPPVAPDVRYRYMGRMQTPAGATLVYLSDGDQALPIQPGDQLPNGFVVEGIDEDGVRLLYPPADRHVVIAIPSSP